MIITLSGMPGSGKSTVAKILARRLRMKRYYIGELRRKMAKERGMTLDELNRLGEREAWTDKVVDDYQKELGEREDNFIIEGRTSFFLIPHSVKIFLDVDIRAGAARIFREIRKGASKRNEGDPQSLEEALKNVRERIASDRKRYKKYYNIDFLDKAHYDIVIDTTKITAARAAEKILLMLKKVKKN